MGVSRAGGASINGWNYLMDLMSPFLDINDGNVAGTCFRGISLGVVSLFLPISNRFSSHCFLIGCVETFPGVGI